jgi:glutamyl-Q tRNA(Asp) synthetase
VHGGRWLIRMEDVDRSREIPGAAAGILRTLEAFGFRWDGEVVRQSERGEQYAAAIERLRVSGLTFECSCSRRDLADEERYPGYCRGGPRSRGTPTAIRLRIESQTVAFVDRLQGAYQQDVAAVVGDPILKRRDGFFSYLLAVVIDDAAQDVTDVVRGADLLDNTPRQIYLQRALGLPAQRYAHVPVLTEADGSKLAKSARALRAHQTTPRFQLFRVLQLLELQPPSVLAGAEIDELWAWARQNYSLKRLSSRRTLPLER